MSLDVASLANGVDVHLTSQSTSVGLSSDVRRFFVGLSFNNSFIPSNDSPVLFNDSVVPFDNSLVPFDDNAIQSYDSSVLSDNNSVPFNVLHHSV
ncbi:unnamed protein product [Sphagnum jensenii]|uniref:Uncharacterized protein n=1 Tax=Sphagnum jensenii TaxID=128206 RepID=A0ABP0VRU4_9BRYO